MAEGCLNQALFIYMFKLKEGREQFLMKAEGKKDNKVSLLEKEIFTHNFCMFPKKNKMRVY